MMQMVQKKFLIYFMKNTVAFTTAFQLQRTNELNDLHHTISNGIMSTTDVFITPTIIRQALRKLKSGKGDGDRGFKSDHLLHSTHPFHVLLCYVCFLILC